MQVLDYLQTGEEHLFLLLLFISDGGKLELWDLETGTTVRSVRGHDEDAVTAVKVTMVTSNSGLGGQTGGSHALHANL